MTKEILIRAVKISLCAAAIFTLSSCSTITYYSQSVIGHSRLMLARQPVDSVIESADDALKSQLKLSKKLKQFSVTELGLPNSKSYTSYVVLDREFPVWTVVAAPRFSLQAKQWCYPIIGCASYRGYFSLQSAQKYAQELQLQDYETSVSGASAYSTLGWFNDPLLSSMMSSSDADFAETLFHELAHQKLYINGDSDFNEAFASLIGEVGTSRWLSLYRPGELAAYNEKLKIRSQFYDLVSSSKQELETLFQSSASFQTIQLFQAMESGKRSILQNLRARYELLKAQEWRGHAWYESWFNGTLNNADFAALSTYRERIPAIRSLLEACDHDLKKFYNVISESTLLHNKVMVPGECAGGLDD